jgi:hypothetical protein
MQRARLRHAWQLGSQVILLKAPEDRAKPEVSFGEVFQIAEQIYSSLLEVVGDELGDPSLNS